MRPLITCPQNKLVAVEFRFKKTEERIAIYKETYEKADEWFQSIYAEAASLTNKLGVEEKQPGLCGQLINWNKIGFLKKWSSNTRKSQYTYCYLKLYLLTWNFVSVKKRDH